MNLFPLCTASVWPTKSGVIVELRAQVLITRFSPREFISSTFLSRLASMNGPFFRLLGIVLSVLAVNRHGQPPVAISTCGPVVDANDRSAPGAPPTLAPADDQLRRSLLPLARLHAVLEAPG